ncbi:MAG TPA: DUF4331 domain-containing protein [Gaiellaceae bacterium]|nr:DUF4331 domain-containing protein [Gaiellaceae bacterium]
MRKLALGLALAAAFAATVAIATTRGSSPQAANASSHREAPLISEDPTADNTDVYAFVSPDKPDTATIIANWIPGEDPAAGPNYYTFSPSARYDIYIDQNGDGKPDTTYAFRFKNQPSQFFLGNTQQSYTVTKVAGKRSTVVGSGLLTPPDNIGPRSTPDYASLAAKGIHTLDDGSTVFAGQRDDAFFADVGAIFDLVAIRSGTGANGGGKDFLAGYGVHAIALQIPKSQLDNGGNHTIGVWAATDRQKAAVSTSGKGKGNGSWVQVSRLGNPLINEVVIPTQLKDEWNASTPDKDKQFAKYYENPILATVLQKLYPQFGPFQDTKRDDLVQLLLTGLKTPALNYTGPTQADELRLNLSIPPTPFDKINRLGVLGNDLAGYPNGRRLEDDVVDISERAVGGVLIGHSLPLGDGVDANDVPNLHVFPYEPAPFSGFDNTKGVQKP